MSLMPFSAEAAKAIEMACPYEGVTQEDADAAAYEEAQSPAYNAVQDLLGVIDELCDPPAGILDATIFLEHLTVKVRASAMTARSMRAA